MTTEKVMWLCPFIYYLLEFMIMPKVVGTHGWNYQGWQHLENVKTYRFWAPLQRRRMPGDLLFDTMVNLTQLDLKLPWHDNMSKGRLVLGESITLPGPRDPYICPYRMTRANILIHLFNGHFPALKKWPPKSARSWNIHICTQLQLDLHRHMWILSFL